MWETLGNGSLISADALATQAMQTRRALGGIGTGGTFGSPLVKKMNGGILCLTLFFFFLFISSFMFGQVILVVVGILMERMSKVGGRFLEVGLSVLHVAIFRLLL